MKPARTYWVFFSPASFIVVTARSRRHLWLKYPNAYAISLVTGAV